MGGGQSLGFDASRVRRIWSTELGTDQKYLHAVLLHAVTNKQLAKVFLPNDGQVTNAAEIEFILDNLAENLHEFFGQLLETDHKFDEFYDLCFGCGKRHAAYATHAFLVGLSRIICHHKNTQDEYWTAFEEAFIEVATKRIDPKKEKDLAAWISFIGRVIAFMREGYTDGRSTQKGGDVDIHDD